MSPETSGVCEHVVGVIRNECVTAADWDAKLREFAERVLDFNVRGLREQVNHPGFATPARFCPLCGHGLAALKLLNYATALEEAECAAAPKVRFGDLPVGSFFKETPTGAWILKSSGGVGRYRANGVDGEPVFDADELVIALPSPT